MNAVRGTPYSHRLHYRWSQIEADRSGISVGSASRPLPKVDRTLHLQGDCRENRYWQSTPAAVEERRFSRCADVYKNIEYNTFSRNGALKLTEVEIFFLSSMMTRQTACKWLLVYIGVGNGERFRHIRDEFFPELAVMAYDPIDERYCGSRAAVLKRINQWNSDGTDYTFVVRCFDVEADPDLIREKAGSKGVLVISDVRGVNLLTDGSSFDKLSDNELQWQAIKGIRPVMSLVKFAIPHENSQFYEYPPGVLLKQAFCNWDTREVRLLIEGVPQQTTQYNRWELNELMRYHHNHLRGLVYETTRRADCAKCIDFCFDCSVLWDTLSTYAARNQMDPYEVLDKVVKYHVYTPPHEGWWGEEGMDVGWVAPSPLQRWKDVQWALKKGRLTEAIAALEADGDTDAENVDWLDIADLICEEQPNIAKRLKISLQRPASRSDLIQVIGSLAEPFTFVTNVI